MKKITIIGLLLIGMLPYSYTQQNVTAVIVYLKGKVEIMKNGKNEYTPAKINETLSPGDRIKTSRKSTASVVIKSGAEIRINENSEFELSDEGKMKETAKLESGQIWTRTLHKISTVKIRTPHAVCGVRGTEADIEQRELLTVKVYEGYVDVENQFGKQTLMEGQMTNVLGPNTPPASPKKMDKKDIGNWQNAIKTKNLEKILEMLQNSGDQKTLKIKVQKDEKEKEIELKMRKKQ